MVVFEKLNRNKIQPSQNTAFFVFNNIMMTFARSPDMVHRTTPFLLREAS